MLSRLIYATLAAITLSLAPVACTTSDSLRGRSEDTDSTPVQPIDPADAPYARQLDGLSVRDLAAAAEQFVEIDAVQCAILQSMMFTDF